MVEHGSVAGVIGVRPWCKRKSERGTSMATRGSAFRAEGNRALRTLCAHCGTSIPTEVGHAHPLDEALRRETWGLVGHTDGPPSVFPTCTACYDGGWRPPGFARLSG